MCLGDRIEMAVNFAEQRKRKLTLNEADTSQLECRIYGSRFTSQQSAVVNGSSAFQGPPWKFYSRSVSQQAPVLRFERTRWLVAWHDPSLFGWAAIKREFRLSTAQ
jgi:hypothetical protein